MRRNPLPPELAGSAFRTSEARNAGVARTRLDARDLFAPFHGVRAPMDAAAETVAQRCALLHPRLNPAQFFSHTTAAELWGLPLPAGHTHTALHVSAARPGREPRTVGVTGHRLDIDIAHLTLRSGLPVPSLAETWAQLGGMLRLDDLVAAADAALHSGGVDAAELTTAANRLRRRGALDLRTALTEMRTGAESPRETLTRLAIVRAGLPEPRLNWQLRTSAGSFVARLDMAYPRYRVAVEYDGRQHADHAQFTKDADRWSNIDAEGWLLVRVLAHHFADPQRDIVARVRRALASRGWHA